MMSERSTEWLGKPYYSLDAYCKNTFQHKCYKLSLDAGMTCPNRDGTLDYRGCIFCSAGGSGDFAISGSAPCSGVQINEQLRQSRQIFGAKKTGDHFIAYFQAYTNTYAPISYLREVYTAALQQSDILGISIATRPDCLSGEVLELLTELKVLFPDKFIWIELGLQTIHETTALYIRRGYSLDCFDRAAADLQRIGIPCIVHVILGLPGETPSQIYETIRYLNSKDIFGIKLQLLHVLEHTDLAADYHLGRFRTYEKEEYLDILIHCLELLSPHIVIHRVTGDGPKDLLIAPRWSLNKRDVLNTLHKKMKERNTYQGRLFHASRSTDTI